MSPPRRAPGRPRTAHTPAQVRQVIGEGLRARKGEIEQELLARVGAFAGNEVNDPEYVYGLRKSVTAALEFGIACMESTELSAPPVPAILYAQARLAARNGVDLSTVVQRYVDGYTLLEGFADEVAEAEELLGSPALREVRRVSSTLFRHLIAEVSVQHEQEVRSRTSSPESRLTNLVCRLIDGEPIDTSQLNYDLDAFHVGLVGSGPGTPSAMRGLADELDCIPLVIETSDASTWAWLGRRRAPDMGRIQKLVAEHWPSRSFLSIGEIGDGQTGWRLTHHQARAGAPVSHRRADRCFRYGDDPFLVALLQDNLLAESFRQMYLSPLSEGPDGGQKLCQTLRAYFAAERNGASAAEALKVSRQTIKNHLHTVEERLDRPLAGCIANVEAALRLDALDRF